MSDPAPITQLLAEARGGDRGALDRLLPLVYDELRAIARRQARRTAPDSTLNTTAVVHEVYLKLFGRGTGSLQDRVHFFSVACLAMRQVLRDHGRRHRARKRGSGEALLPLEEWDAPVEADVDAFLDVDRALDRLGGLNARLAQVAELRYLAGLSVEEVAELLQVTPRTVLRDWRKARAFLLVELGRHEPA